MTVRATAGKPAAALAKRTASAASVLLVVVTCIEAAAAEPEISQLAWLAGCWQSDGGEPGSGEQWTSLAGGTMLGTSRTVRQGRTVEFEFMQLRHLPDGRLAFIAIPSGQRAAVFPLLRLDEREAVFENLQHDFPQRVVYAREGPSRLRARIEGTSDGDPQVIEFPMSRINCGSLFGSREAQRDAVETGAP